MATTQTIWFTRDTVTVRHLRGLVHGLDLAEAVDYAEVKIVAIAPGMVVTLPAAAVTSIDNAEATPGGDYVMTYENLPVEGILWAADED